MPPPPSLTPLVVRFGAFGDMLLIVPMLKLLAARYGAPCDVVSSGPWTEPLLSRVPACGRRVLLTSRRAPYWLNRSQRQLARWLRSRPPGPVYVFEPDEKCHALLRRGRIKPEWICSLRDFPRQPGEHICAHALRLARETPAALRGPDGYGPPPNLELTMRPTLTSADRRDCEEWLARLDLVQRPLVLIQPGNKKTMRRGSRQRTSNVKYWPEPHWAAVIGAVRTSLPDARILLCGSPRERPLAEDIRRLAGSERVVIATDDLPIPRLLALQERAHSMISVDTGPAHAAAAMGCPLVVLFARIDPQLYAPLPTTAPVRILAPDPVASDGSMASIPSPDVIAAWRALPAG